MGTLPIRIWDESRLAINALEMLDNKDFIVTHFENKPDMWNTKPPLNIWLQVLSISLFGISEFAIRFPSAVAAFLSCVVIFFFTVKYLKNYYFGLISIFVLITCHGYINIHASRTGDYDSLLCLFTTLSALSYFYFLETKIVKYYYVFFISLILAVMTKGINGLLILPALFFYTIYLKEFKFVFFKKETYFGISIFIFLVMCYYFMREHYNHGYLKSVFENELGGRFLNVIENHHASGWYYYFNFIHFQILEWYLLVPCGVLIGIYHKNEKIRRLSIFSTLFIFCFIAIISAASTKLEWYDVPSYPFISIIIAVSIFFIFELIQSINLNSIKLKINVLPVIFLFLVFIAPYRKIVNKTYKPVEYPWDVNFYRISYYLKDAIQGKHDLNKKFLVYEDYNAHLLFYLKTLQKSGINFNFKSTENVQQGDQLVIPQSNVQEKIRNSWNTELLEEDNSVVTFLIKEKK